MKADSYLELGIFGMNASSGVAMTEVPERWQLKWEKIVKIAKFADQKGFDFLLPIGRWRGYGGSTNPTGESFETFNFAAALSGVTDQINLFATVHVPFIHPVYAARCATTIDHASGGRLRLNIVCGWSLEEFQMFGLSDYNPQKRYVQGTEWVDIYTGVLSDEPTFDYAGEFYDVQEAVCQPKSIQRPRPPLMSAAFSPTGQEFAIGSCDILFTMFSNVDISKRRNEKLLENARTIGRGGARVITSAHVVCRETRQEAESYYQKFAEDMADTAAAAAFAEKMAATVPKVGVLQKAQLKRIAGGAGTFPIIGSPEDVAEQLIEVHAAGFSGIGMSFVDYTNELPFFSESVLPKLKKAGIHHGLAA